MKVLIAEDDPVALRVLEATLLKLGHEPVVARDGEKAWTLLCESNLRVVVSDWLMPRLDGLELCRRIRAEEGRYVYFILLTGMSATDENQQLAVEAGVDDFLVKPIKLQELWMRLRVAERILQITTQVRQLESILPMCSYCRKVRDDKDYWQQIEGYLDTHTGTSVSHGVCPECMEKTVKPQLAQLRLGLPPSPDISNPQG